MILHLLKFVFIPDNEMVRNDPEAFAFQPKIRFYTMTSYIKPQIAEFVKNFFRFFYSFLFFAKKRDKRKGFMVKGTKRTFKGVLFVWFPLQNPIHFKEAKARDSRGRGISP